MTTASSFKRLEREAPDRLYHGVMVDLATKIKAGGEDKEIIRGLPGNFPMAQLKLDRKTGGVSTFSSDRRRGGLIEEFLHEECLAFKPRKFRYNVRKRIHFNVLFIDAPDPDVENVSRSITMDVSRGGCFIFSAGRIGKGDRVRFVLKELNEKTPVTGVVRYRIAWGDAMRVPGVGLEFTEIREDQQKEIVKDFMHMVEQES